jgi:DNA-binding GntR family transcriptional regulator
VFERRREKLGNFRTRPNRASLPEEFDVNRDTARRAGDVLVNNG